MFGDPSVPTVKFAGDIVKMGEREHAAKGLCQERAYVSGLQAADLLVEGAGGSGKGVLQCRDDEAQFKAGAGVIGRMRKALRR
mmetsp:Transcript_5610/g.10616  ORF Transcript_5610/g.10616 Transcript_5610/m.10616 type:complete len:83 (+) Transcript_5610:1275-1523(+)